MIKELIRAPLGMRGFGELNLNQIAASNCLRETEFYFPYYSLISRLEIIQVDNG
jgi:hypothetical protein